MKIMTFFSEKGGVGKSSFSIMYASWLNYINGVKVGVADFNNRISGYRNEEILRRDELIRQEGADKVKPFDTANAWPIVGANLKEIMDLERKTNMPYAKWLEKEITKGKLAGMDVVLCDFPGSMTGGEMLQIYTERMLNLIVVPVEKDVMTMHSTKKLNEMLKKAMRSEYCMFINRAKLDLTPIRKQYFKFGPLLVGEGYPVLPDIVSYSERMLTIDKVDIIRSTFGFPDFDKPEFAGSKDLGINNLFIDITRLLNKTQDYKGTGQTDLSFIYSLDKKNDGRQFSGSAFPDLEL